MAWVARAMGTATKRALATDGNNTVLVNIQTESKANLQTHKELQVLFVCPKQILK